MAAWFPRTPGALLLWKTDKAIGRVDRFACFRDRRHRAYAL
jgi:hypothetical protein